MEEIEHDEKKPKVFASPEKPRVILPKGGLATSGPSKPGRIAHHLHQPKKDKSRL